MWNIILSCLLMGHTPQPLFDRVPPAPVRVLGTIRLGEDESKYKVTNYTDFRMDGEPVKEFKDIPPTAVPDRIDVSDGGYVTHLWFRSKGTEK